MIAPKQTGASADSAINRRAVRLAGDRVAIDLGLAAASSTSGRIVSVILENSESAGVRLHERVESVNYPTTAYESGFTIIETEVQGIPGIVLRK